MKTIPLTSALECPPFAIIDKGTWEIVLIGSHYCYVDHKNGLLTTGFKTEAKLIEYKPLFPTDRRSREFMLRRYKKNY